MTFKKAPMPIGVKIYYVISAVIDVFFAILFLILAFPLSHETLMCIISSLLFLYLLSVNIYSIVKDAVLLGVILWKFGVFLMEFGFFAVSEYILSNGAYISNIIIAFISCALGLLLILLGIKIVNSTIKEELEEEKENAVNKAKNGYTYRLAEGQPKVKKIWQYKLHAKPGLTQEQSTRKNIILISSVVGFVLGILIPIVMMFTFDMENIYESVIGNIFVIISIASILTFAVTLGSYKSHGTGNFAFVLCEDGSVFLIDYFERRVAKDFGYLNLVPIVRTGLYAHYFGADADYCYTYIRHNEIDKRIAENCAYYGRQIIAVPQLCKCSFYTDMTFVLWDEGKPLEIKNWYNLYDNCYEGYDEMIDYLDTHFDHKFDEEYVSKTNTIKGFTIAGAIGLAIGIIVWLIGPIIDENLPIAIGFLISVVSSSFFVVGFERLKRRRKVL